MKSSGVDARVRRPSRRRAAARRGGSGSSGLGTTALSPPSSSTHIRCARPSFAPIVLTTCTSGSRETPKLARVPLADRLAQVRQPAARRVAVVDGLGGGLGELLDRDRGRGDVGVAEAEIDHVATLAPKLALQLVDGREDVRGEIVNSPKLQVGATIRESTTMPVDVLRCRVCESDYPALANGICVRCFGPLEPVYDWDELAASVTPRAHRGRAVLALALRRPAARRRRPPDAASGPGFTPLVPRRGSRARSASARCCSSSTSRTRPTRSRTASSPSRPRRRSSSASRRSRAPRPATSRTRSPRAPRARGMPAVIFCPAGLEPEKMLATTVYGARVYGVRGSYDDCSRLDQRARRRGRLGLRQRQPALLLRRGLEDARVRDRRAARLGVAGRGRRADRLGRDVHASSGRASSSSAGSG